MQRNRRGARGWRTSSGRFTTKITAIKSMCPAKAKGEGPRLSPVTAKTSS